MGELPPEGGRWGSGARTGRPAPPAVHTLRSRTHAHVGSGTPLCRCRECQPAPASRSISSLWRRCRKFWTGALPSRCLHHSCAGPRKQDSPCLPCRWAAGVCLSSHAESQARHMAMSPAFPSAPPSVCTCSRDMLLPCRRRAAAGLSSGAGSGAQRQGHVQHPAPARGGNDCQALCCGFSRGAPPGSH